MSNPNQALTKLESQPVLEVGRIIDAIVKSQMTPENVTVVERLIALQERQEAKKAEQDFDDAFALMQSQMQQVQAVKPVGTLYKYATYEDIMKAVQPLLTEFGFSVSFDTEMLEKQVTVTCILSRKGHRRTNKFTCRTGTGPRGASEAQADSSAANSAQRQALCDALNIVVSHSDDKRNLGRPITKDQADCLRKRVKETGSDENSFLEFADARTYEEIKSEKYAELDAALRKKEKTA